MKGNVANLTNSLEKVLQMRPVAFNYKSRKFYGHDTIPDSLIAEGDTSRQMMSNELKQRLNALPEYEDILHYGFIAQELKKVCPTVVAELGPTEGVNLPEIVPILVKAIQEQQQTIENLHQEIENWKGKTLDTPSSKTRLFQNNPNPLDQTTTFSYYIDENDNVATAVLEVRDIMGVLKSSITLADISGLGQVGYNASNLNTGYFIYTLKINGSIKDSKMMLIER